MIGRRNVIVRSCWVLGRGAVNNPQGDATPFFTQKEEKYAVEKT